MTFYQELQLNQAGSKAYVASFIKPKDKFIHILTWVFKVLLNLGFSMAVVMGLTMAFGAENSIAGLVALLGISTFRFTNLDIKATHSIGGIFLIFFILAVGPKAANLVPLGCGFLINAVCILFIVILGCHNARQFNHAILVLSYILLYGSDVGGFSYVKRILCLLVGAVLTAAVLYRNTRKKVFEYKFKNLFTDFSLSNERSRWQIKIALCVSGAILVATVLGFTKPVWAGIAAMSVTVPLGEVKTRVESRIRGNVIGTIIFIAIYLIASLIIVPSGILTYLSMVGGVCAGFAGRYEGQTAWNSFCSMSIAAMTFSFAETVIFRVLNNVLGAVFALLFGMIIEQLLLSLNSLIKKISHRNQPNA